MTNTRPNPKNPTDLGDNGSSKDGHQDRDSLQEQARRETSKAEGDDRDDGRRRPTTPPVANPD